MDIDFSQVFFDTDSLACSNEINLSTLFPECKSHTSSYAEKNLTPVSNTEWEPTSSDCNVKKKTLKTCGEISSQNTHLMQHGMIHERKISVYTCSICNKSFSRRCNLLQHRVSHEQKNCTTVCSVCDKTFKHNRYLKKHMKRIHTQVKLFSCDVCLKKFSSKFMLKRHELSHNNHEKEKPSFKCIYCKVVFIRMGLLKKHLRCYENSTYACTICHQKFCRKRDLKVHDCHTVESTPAQTSSQNPRCEKMKYDCKRKYDLKECCTITFDNYEESALNLHAFLMTLIYSVESEVKYHLFENKYLKCIFTLEGIVEPTLSEEKEIYTLYLDSNVILIVSENRLSECIEKVFTEMVNEYSKLEIEWKLTKIIKLDIFCIQFNSL